MQEIILSEYATTKTRLVIDKDNQTYSIIETHSTNEDMNYKVIVLNRLEVLRLAMAIISPVGGNGICSEDALDAKVTYFQRYQ